MLVQQDLINSFYKELEKFLASDVSDVFDLFEQKDRDFLNSRPLVDNLSVDFWISCIVARVKIEPCIFSTESPFISYSANRVWLRLAYDLAKIISKKYSENRLNWLNILYPDLVLQEIRPTRKFAEHSVFQGDETRITDVYLLAHDDSSTASTNQEAPLLEFSKRSIEDKDMQYSLALSYFDDGVSKVYIVKHLPKFAKFRDAKAVSKLISYDYYLKFHESYFYVLSEKRLYYVYADGYVEDVRILNRVLFSEELKKLLNNPTFLKSDPFEINNESLIDVKRFTKISKKDLERLIVDCGGYPNLDLRSYYLSDDGTKLFSVKSFLFPREVMLDGASIGHMYTLSYNKYGKNYNNFDNSQDILPHVVFDDSKYKQPRPLSLVEFAGLRYKLDNKPYINGHKTFTLSRRFIIDVFDNKWADMQVSIPRHLLVSLIHVLREFYNITDFRSYINFKKILNNWSKRSLQNNFKEIFSVYKEDFEKLLDEKKYLYLLNRCEHKGNNIFWFGNEIREIYKLYSTSINIRLNQKDYRYHIFDLLLNIVLSNSFSNVSVDVLSILKYCLNECPDQLPLFVDVNIYSEIKARIVNNTKLIEKFELILTDCSIENENDIKSIIKDLASVEINQEISHRCKRQIVRVFARHDSEVKFSEDDHNKALTHKNNNWIRLAQLLTGMGYFDDYLQLLCPTLAVYIDKITGKPFSHTDLRDLIFTYDRKHLINVSHSRNMHKILGFGFDCNGYKLRYLGYEEVKQIKEADPKFNSYYKELSKQNLDKPVFNFRIIIGLYRLVSATAYTKKSDSNNNYLFIVTDSPNNIKDIKFQSAVNYYFNKHIVKTIIIKIYSDGHGLDCYIDYNNQGRSAHCIIYNHEFSKRLPTTLTNDNFAPFRLELLHILRKKSFLNLEYDEEIEGHIDREYAIFNKLYANLTTVERNLLNSTTIFCRNKAVYFKDIYSVARYDIVTANLYFIYMLQNLSPRITFNLHLRYQYLLITNPFDNRRQEYLSYKDPTEEIDKLFVSFMTHGFVPEGSLPMDYRKYMFYDIHFLYPTHQILYWAINSFETYYSSIIDSPKNIDAKLEYLYDIFPRFFYAQIDEYATKANPGGYFQEVYNWINKVIQGDVFKFIHLFELNEILDIANAIQDSEALFLEHTSQAIINFRNEIMILYQRPISLNKAIANIKLIKLFSLLNRYEVKFTADMKNGMTTPYCIYLDSNRTYTVANGNNETRKGNIPLISMRLLNMDTQINEVEFKKRVWSVIAHQGDLSLSENDFIMVFSVIYQHKTLNIHAKNLLKSFLISQEIEEIDEEKVKMAIISIFELDRDLTQSNARVGMFKPSSSDLDFERIFEQLVKKANQDALQISSKRAISPSAVGWEI